jgi:hypothetical protein
LLLIICTDFLLYVNDLPLYLRETILELYADDTTIHTSNESVHIINNKFQNDLVQVKNWCKNKYYVNYNNKKARGRRRRDDRARIVVGFTTTFAISDFHH